MFLLAIPVFTLLIYFVAFCIVAFILWYAANNLLPEPMRRIANVLIIVVALLLLVAWLLSLVGGGPFPKLT